MNKLTLLAMILFLLGCNDPPILTIFGCKTIDNVGINGQWNSLYFNCEPVNPDKPWILITSSKEIGFGFKFEGEWLGHDNIIWYKDDNCIELQTKEKYEFSKGLWIEDGIN